MEWFGILSGVFFNISAVGSVYKVWKQGHADDMMDSFFYPWILGSYTGFVYSIHLFDKPLMFSFGLGVVCGSGILFVKGQQRFSKKRKRDS